MRTLLLLALGLSTLLSGLAQKPHRCKSPPYLEGKLTAIFPEGKTMVFEQFYYDAFEQRIRVIAAGQESNHSLHVDILMLFRERVYYEINYQNQSCVKMPLSAAFIPIEIPYDAQHNAQFVLGTLSAPGQGLLVNDWVGFIPEYQAKYSMSVTEFGCIPITFLYHIEKMGHVLSSFYDIVVGIENPEVFVPPAFCGSAKLVEQTDGKAADFFTALNSN
ncbi:ependymin [Electrophorus electricus]|uniref:Ependymin-like 1 n=1 Tax=Electrophorus electricus TaxID=8005 RepID=A0A4W4H9N7_ELEEL|nr:ependymin [Electrophorus electricus]